MLTVTYGRRSMIIGKIGHQNMAKSYVVNGCVEADHARWCPICRGDELAPDFIATLEQAVSANPIVSMTAEEAIEWINSL